MLAGKGGLFAYLGHKDAHLLEKLAREGDPKARLIQDAMAYQISKEIGAMAAVLGGEVHAIIITGGIAHNPDLTGYIKEHVGFIAPVFIYPGEDEMRALALNGSMMMSGKISPREYSGENKIRGIDLESLDSPQGVETDTGSIFPLKYSAPSRVNHFMNSAIWGGSSGAL